MNKDNKVLIYSTRAISSIYSKLLVEQMNIVENFADDIHIMTHTKTDKSYKLAKGLETQSRQNTPTSTSSTKSRKTAVTGK
jgi:hypothetical protein